MSDVEALLRYHIQQHIELLRFFEYSHLLPELEETARPFHLLAEEMSRTLPVCAETTAGLRKLLEAKDCFVRAALMKRDGWAPAATPPTDHTA
jgi:hypothetical protein